MRLFQQIKNYAASAFVKYGPVTYAAVKLYNDFSDSAMHYVSTISYVRDAKKKLELVTQSISEAEDVREFVDGATQLFHYFLKLVANGNEAKRKILTYSLITNSTLVVEVVAYFAVVRPAMYWFSDDYKLQTLDYLAQWRLWSDAAAVTVENVALIAALNKICAEEVKTDLYPPCDDMTVARNFKANLASPVYYLGYKATLVGVNWIPLVGPWLRRAGQMFVEGQAIAEFRLTNQCTEHRYNILRFNTTYSIGAGAVVVGSAYIVNKGLCAATGVNSDLVESAVTNVIMLFNILAMNQRRELFSGDYAYSEVMYLPRKITALVMKEIFSYTYEAVKNNEKPPIEESVVINKEDVLVPFKRALTDAEIYDQLADVVSQFTRFFLGKRFATLESAMQIEAFRMAINANESNISYALSKVKWVQDSKDFKSKVIKFSLDWLEYLPSFCSPAKSTTQGMQFFGQVVYATFAKRVIDKLDTSFNVEFVTGNDSEMKERGFCERYFTRPVKQLSAEFVTDPMNLITLVAADQNALVVAEPVAEEKQLSNQLRPPLVEKAKVAVGRTLFGLFSRRSLSAANQVVSSLQKNERGPLVGSR